MCKNSCAAIRQERYVFNKCPPYGQRAWEMVKALPIPPVGWHQCIKKRMVRCGRIKKETTAWKNGAKTVRSVVFEKSIKGVS